MNISRRTFHGMVLAGALGAGAARAGDAAPFRIGIVGSDNSHAIRFAELCNKTDRAGRSVPGARVTHLWGVEAERNVEVAELGAIPAIVDAPEEMLGAVDGVICVRRHGSHHLADARPFIEAGLPVFVDKPLAASRADAETLIALAQEKGVGFSSFSTLRFATPTRDFIAGLDETVGELLGGGVAGPCDPESEYDGIFFYAIHSVELMHAAFGFGVASVAVTTTPERIVAVCTYPGGQAVTLELFRRIRGFHVRAHGARASAHHTVDTDSTYYDGLPVILRVLREGYWPLDPEQLLEPVLVLEAIERGMREPGAPVAVRA